MPAAPTNETNEPAPPRNAAADDPWRVPAPRPAAKKTAVKKSAAPSIAKTAARQARMNRAAQANAAMAARMTWPMARGWTLAGAVCRLLAAGALVGCSLEMFHLHSLFVAPTTTVEQWDAAVRTADTVNDFSLLIFLAMFVSAQAWLRTRSYVAKLPGVAPHPMQSSNGLYRSMSLPAFWPPVPQGVPSWTRRVHWRVPPGLTIAIFLLLAVTNLADRGMLTAPGRFTFTAVTDLLEAGLGVLCAALDLVRLRAYSRWPGRP